MIKFVFVLTQIQIALFFLIALFKAFNKLEKLSKNIYQLILEIPVIYPFKVKYLNIILLIFKSFKTLLLLPVKIQRLRILKKINKYCFDIQYKSVIKYLDSCISNLRLLYKLIVTSFIKK